MSRPMPFSNLITYRIFLVISVNSQGIISSTDVIQLTLTLKMSIAQVVETSVTVNNNVNSPIQDYVHPDDQTQPTFEMTPWLKPFTDYYYHYHYYYYYY